MKKLEAQSFQKERCHCLIKTYKEKNFNVIMGKISILKNTNKDY